MQRRKDEFCVSSRRRLQDSIPLGNNEYMSAYKLLETDPVRLWNLVHTKGSKVGLSRPLHFKLKQIISEVAPELIAVNDVKRELRKSKMKLSKAISSGTIGTDKSSYKRLN
jgi:hypothetical protein